MLTAGGLVRQPASERRGADTGRASHSSERSWQDSQESLLGTQGRPVAMAVSKQAELLRRAMDGCVDDDD